MILQTLMLERQHEKVNYKDDGSFGQEKRTSGSSDHVGCHVQCIDNVFRKMKQEFKVTTVWGDLTDGQAASQSNGQ